MERARNTHTMLNSLFGTRNNFSLATPQIRFKVIVATFDIARFISVTYVVIISIRCIYHFTGNWIQHIVSKTQKKKLRKNLIFSLYALLPYRFDMSFAPKTFIVSQHTSTRQSPLDTESKKPSKNCVLFLCVEQKREKKTMT